MGERDKVTKVDNTRVEMQITEIKLKLKWQEANSSKGWRQLQDKSVCVGVCVWKNSYPNIQDRPSGWKCLLFQFQHGFWWTPTELLQHSVYLGHTIQIDMKEHDQKWTGLFSESCKGLLLTPSFLWKQRHVFFNTIILPVFYISNKM